MGVGGAARHKGLMRHAWPAIVVYPRYPRPATVPPILQSFSSLVPRTTPGFLRIPYLRHPQQPHTSQVVKPTSSLSMHTERLPRRHGGYSMTSPRTIGAIPDSHIRDRLRLRSHLCCTVAQMPKTTVVAGDDERCMYPIATGPHARTTAT
jgi:hypothetical protein